MIWGLRTIFLRKFQFVFNENSHSIGIYKYYEGDDILIKIKFMIN